MAFCWLQEIEIVTPLVMIRKEKQNKQVSLAYWNETFQKVHEMFNLLILSPSKSQKMHLV